jgi:signal transduction histidine kinase
VAQFKTTLLAAVGHELRTPLAAIKGHSSTLLQEDVVWPPDDQRHFLQTISTEADRLAQMVTNLLDLARVEAGLLPLQRGPARLADLVEQAVQRVGRPLPDLAVRLPADLPLLAVDGPRIGVVLYNLLANALAYGEGAVAISAAPQGAGWVAVRVTDNGPGIAPDELPHVFERFYRAQRGLQRRSGGTGLGLAICKAFVEAHGGTIWAESAPGGTTIAFTLPTVESILLTG